MTPSTHGSMPGLRVGGAELPARVVAAIRSVVVESDAHGPDSCRIVLDDPSRDLLGSAGLELNSSVELTAARTGEPVGELLFEGTVYGLGFEYDERGASSLITAYDRSYALYTGRHTKTYLNKTDADVAREIAREVQLDAGDIAATPVVHDHLSQFNETHWDFLARRAREIGFLVRVVGAKLDFTSATDAAGAPAPGTYRSNDRLQLVPGGNLEQLTARLTAAQQVAEVEVRGWDQRTKKELVAVAPATTTSAQLRDTPAALAGQHGRPRHVTADLPLGTQAECDAAVGAESERIAGTFAHVEGVAHGDPRLRAGTAVSLGQTGRLDGQLTLSRSRHVWNRSGYRTHFSVAGRQDRSVSGMIASAADRSGGARVPGVVIAVVSNIEDPEKRGRVQLTFPWLGPDYQTDWARVVHLGAGNDYGLLMLPQVKDEVLVSFEQGDTRRPVVLGGLYNGVDTMPWEDDAVGENGKVARRGFLTPTGQRLMFTDEAQGARTIEIATKDDSVKITLDAEAKTLKIETDKDIEVISSNGHVKVDAQAGFELRTAGKGVIHADGELALTAGGNAYLDGAMVNLGQSPVG